jgi:hypothetical protein
LNKTYVFYGAAESRKAREQLQARQDQLAAGAAPGAGAQRAVAKSNKEVYKNSDYDLVDALDEKKVKLEEVKEEDLPEEIRGKKLEEKQAYVEKNHKKPTDLQAKIKTLGAEREKYVVEERKRSAEKGVESLDTAVIKSVRDQAAKRKFQFEESEAPKSPEKKAPEKSEKPQE